MDWQPMPCGSELKHVRHYRIGRLNLQFVGMVMNWLPICIGNGGGGRAEESVFEHR